MVQKPKLLFFLLSLCLLMLLNLCDRKEEPLPFAYISKTYSLYDAAFLSLQAVGGSSFIDYEGVSGVIVYRKSLEEIVAYDANCTYKPEDRCALQISEFSNQAKDSLCCGSVFQLYDGTPISGPASRALYEYNVIFNGGDRFTITNY